MKNPLARTLIMRHVREIHPTVWRFTSNLIKIKFSLPQVTVIRK